MTSSTQALRKEKWGAHRAIDEAAGLARLRHITDVPGQQAVYLQKLEQARSYTAAHAVDAAAAVPAYIAAEAAATGAVAIDLAASIVAAADLWNNETGPAIEGARLGAKAAVTAGQSEQDIADAQAAGIAALDAI